MFIISNWIPSIFFLSLFILKKVTWFLVFHSWSLVFVCILTHFSLWPPTILVINIQQERIIESVFFGRALEYRWNTNLPLSALNQTWLQFSEHYPGLLKKSFFFLFNQVTVMFTEHLWHTRCSVSESKTLWRTQEIGRTFSTPRKGNSLLRPF